MPEPRTVHLGVRTTPEIRDAAKQAAEDDRRSISTFVETLLIAHLIAHRYLASRPGSPKATAKKGAS
jgi:hypothetical protein